MPDRSRPPHLPGLHALRATAMPARLRRLALACGIAAVLALGIGTAAPGLAQTSPASLVADSLRVVGDRQLVAEGNVEVLVDGARLTARRITYDRRTDTIAIEGPIRLSDGDRIVILASEAELARNLRDGLLTGARLVLDRQLQIAAAEIARIGGRYIRAERAVASSCTICETGQTPLWEIRARRVIHDAETRQLHFDNAQFRLGGVPVAVFPRLRLPDATVQRVSGFLLPSVRVTNALGAGVRVPYFLTLGPRRDLTLTPYLSTGQTRTLDLRYRQAFMGGLLAIGGAVTQDSLEPGMTRWYGYARGDFVFGGGVRLEFDGLAFSDEAYLSDYDISSADRQRSHITLWRVQQDRLWRLRGLAFYSLRDDEDNLTTPTEAVLLDWRQRFDVPGIGGVGSFEVSGLALRRPSGDPGDGRDMARISATLDWRRGFLLPAGIEGHLIGQIAADHAQLRQDPAAGGHSRLTTTAGAEFRWPLARTAAGSGAVDVIEPVVQLLWTGVAAGGLVTNDDSTIVEFDEGNLFALSRFPGRDARETGLRGNIGLTWTRHDPSGWESRLTFGRVLRQSAQTGLPQGFPTGGPLSGVQSDWLAAVQIVLPNGLSLANRALFSSDLELTRNDLRLGWNGERLGLSTGITHIAAVAEEGRLDDTSEWSLAATWGIAPGWQGSADWRFDIAAGRFTEAGFGVTYRTECLAVDLSVQRRFTTSGSLRPDTDIGLSVQLLGIGGAVTGAGAGLRQCRG